MCILNNNDCILYLVSCILCFKNFLPELQNTYELLNKEFVFIISQTQLDT